MWKTDNRGWKGYQANAQLMMLNDVMTLESATETRDFDIKLSVGNSYRKSTKGC